VVGRGGDLVRATGQTAQQPEGLGPIGRERNPASSEETRSEDPVG